MKAAEKVGESSGRSTPTSVASSIRPVKASSNKVKVKSQSFTDLKAATAAAGDGAKKADRRRSAAATVKPADDSTARGVKRRAAAIDGKYNSTVSQSLFLPSCIVYKSD